MISVIIPAYNIEKLLPEAIQSVLKQSHRNMEIIVVDDGSTDNTASVAEGFARRDSRVRVIRKENGGVTSARLAGVAVASGEWIGFVDGDDWVEPWMYERLLHNALTHRADISHCGYRRDFPGGRVDLYYGTGTLEVWDDLQSLKELLTGSRIEPGLCNKLFRRELFRNLTSEKLPLDIRTNEDLLMNYWLFTQTNGSVYEDVCPYHYVLRHGSATTSALNRNKLWDPLRVMKLIMEDAAEPLQAVVLERLTRLRISGAAMEVTDQRELVLPYRKTCRKELRQSLGAVLTSGVSLKMKIMTLWTAICPASYGAVHRLYEKATGLDKIYDLD